MTIHTKLALGTAQFGLDYGIANKFGRTSIEEARCILLEAKKNKFNTLDTAIAYGESEVTLGAIGVESWRVISKLPPVPESCLDIRGWVFNETKKSIERLGIKQLHGLLLHSPEQLLQGIGPRLFNSLQDVKREGLVKKIGVSVYKTDALRLLLRSFKFDLVQAPLNILDRSLVESGLAKALHDGGVEVHARSIFLQGLLLLHASNRPPKFASWSEVWKEWDRWLKETGITPLQACLRYALHVPNVDRFVVGVDTVGHLNQIIEAAEGSLISLPAFKPCLDDRLTNPALWSQI